MSDITFRTLGVPHPLLEVLAAEDKHIPFPIQADTLPDTLNGKDVLGRGKTGSGKTLAAFGIGATVALIPRDAGVLCPSVHDRSGLRLLAWNHLQGN